MKVIDLLNKIANEEIKEGIRFKNIRNTDIWEYDGFCFKCKDYEKTFFEMFNFNALNIRIEIIEEPKEVELPKEMYNNPYYSKNHQELVEKINEVISYLKAKEEEKDK